MINKCPLCKTGFTEVLSMANPQLRESFPDVSKKKARGDEGAESDEEDEDDEDEGENTADSHLDEVTPLYGYDDSDGFVVSEDVVEYDSAEEEDSFLDF